MKIMLLGATGYLGGNIARFLSEEGNEVICVVRRTSDISRLKKLRNIRLISKDPGQIELTLEQDCVEWVINGVCTYMPNASLYGDMLESNVIFPLSVLNLAIKYQVKNFITMGTGLPENFNVYSFTKSKFSDFGRFLSEKDGINFGDFRLEMFYGGLYEPEARFLNLCRKKLAKDENILLTYGRQKRDIIHVEDILGIISALIRSEYLQGYRILPVGSGEQHSIREITTYMKQVMGSSSSLKFGAVPERGGEPDTLADISWYKEICYQMKYSFFEGLDKVCLEVEHGGG